MTLTPEGREAGFLQLADNSPDIEGQWDEFPGVYRCYPTAGRRPGPPSTRLLAIPACKTSMGSPFCLQPSSMAPVARFFWEVLRCGGRGPSTRRFSSDSGPKDSRGWPGEAPPRDSGLLLLDAVNMRWAKLSLFEPICRPAANPLEVDSVELNVLTRIVHVRCLPRRFNAITTRRDNTWADFRAAVPGTYRPLVRPQPEDEKQNLNAKIDVVLPNLESDNPRQNAKLLTDLCERRAEGICRSSGQRSSCRPCCRTVVNGSPSTNSCALWDQQWVLYLLVGLLGFEWVIRKLLRLA